MTTDLKGYNPAKSLSVISGVAIVIIIAIFGDTTVVTSGEKCIMLMQSASMIYWGMY